MVALEIHCKLYLRKCGHMDVVVRDPEVLGVLAAPSRKRRSNTVDCIGRDTHLKWAFYYFSLRK